MLQHSKLPVLGVIAIAAVGIATAVLAAETPAGADRPARLEKVEGSDIPRVVLTEQAAKRLDIQTEAVRETEAKRWVLLSGRVDQALAMAEASDTTTSASLSGAAPIRIKVSANRAHEMPAPQVLLALTMAEADDEDGDGLLNEIAEYFAGGDKADQDDDKLALVTLAGSSGGGKQYKARPIQIDSGSDAGAQYFEIIESDGGLTAGQPVFVGMVAPNDGEQAKVVSYSAIIYDAQGASWLYTNPEPLVFVRQSIKIERVLGDLAILLDGPSAGTKVVSVGTAELMGVELKIGH